ncbi:hypothetical protein MSAN_01211900 [Mycena sanguinolenta]|uniref:Uncharacterized protein n=1 Tax=Mycena sanguinolenta TaxID=230812 RepID=A0A8H6YI90_9AGAR|nr:hypothetical protein MSAN_01211900 [Mycena sanguinolenta]
MCRPRNFYCRCPKSWPLRPPFLTFGRTPRRSSLTQLTPSWWTPPSSDISFVPRPNPVIPPLDTRPVIPRRRRVQFIDHDEDDDDDWRWPPVMQTPPPFIPPPVVMPQFPMESLNLQLSNPRGSYPFLDWDLTHFSSTARIRHVPTISTPGGEAPAFAEPATWPHADLITISFADTPMLMDCESRWGPIVVRGQGGTSRAARGRPRRDLSVFQPTIVTTRADDNELEHLGCCFGRVSSKTGPAGLAEFAGVRYRPWAVAL